MPEPTASFRIVANPAHRVVTPGAKIEYRLEATGAAGAACDEIECEWLCINDPALVKVGRARAVMRGPSGPEWKDAQWDVPGHHVVVCRVQANGRQRHYEFPQIVAPLEQVMVGAPVLALEPQDAEAVLDGAGRYVALLEALQEAHPVTDEDKLDKHEDTLAGYELLRDKLEERLESTKGLRRYPVQAEHFERDTQKRTSLRVFLAKDGSEWVLIDWTNATSATTSGEYRGRGTTPAAAIRAAFADWDDDNRYPDGAVAYRFYAAEVGELIQGQFRTNGLSFWDGIARSLSGSRWAPLPWLALPRC